MKMLAASLHCQVIFVSCCQPAAVASRRRSLRSILAMVSSKDRGWPDLGRKHSSSWRLVLPRVFVLPVIQLQRRKAHSEESKREAKRENHRLCYDFDADNFFFASLSLWADLPCLLPLLSPSITTTTSPPLSPSLKPLTLPFLQHRHHPRPVDSIG